MKQFFKELFEYSHHFNQKLGDVYEGNPDQISEKALKLYNHILNAHQIWNNRIIAKETPFGVWEMHPLEDLKVIDKRNFEETLLILERFDPRNSFSYSNTKRQTFQNSIRDTLFHIINHSSYHRGQIATEFKKHGLEPLRTDYILYKR